MDTTHFEKTLSSEVIYQGKVVTLTRDIALLENGREAVREVVHHNGGARSEEHTSELQSRE